MYKTNFIGLLACQQSVALFAQLLKLVFMASYLVLSTNVLGVDDYGFVVVVVGMAAVVSQFVGVGSGVANIRDASKDASLFSEAWGTSLARYMFSGIFLAVGYSVCSCFIFSAGQSFIVYFFIAVSELVLFPLCASAAYGIMGFGLIRTSLMVQVFPSILKIISLSIFVIVLGRLSIEEYILSMVFSGLVSVVACFYIALRVLPKPRYPGIGRILNVKSDFLYPLSGVTNHLSWEGVKPLVLMASGAAESGLFGAASRIVGSAAMPLNSIIQSQAYRLFSYGRELNFQHQKFFKEYALAFSVYGLICILLFWLIKSYWAIVLGLGFEEAGLIISILSLSLPVYFLRQIIGAVLTVTNNVICRVLVDVLSGLVCLGGAWWLIPTKGAIGGALAIILSEVFWLLVVFLMRKSIFDFRIP
ncbi:lipopolysaccharide biosynthesis protein [Gilvimarinus xylanilyticus]|uniref:Polysaccharide biosynthesis protein C-terminal domain-containing protein n=1 Tax=Gilvimarinus xylanilyticus TaxID=2944139 RepID=A0A9X2KTT8_9GAMM|nr:hypothetical protein [Gilvimarinus xylanilyticus]MCP8900221.1 hypothetical protein [Gilvimarinus xylanilyticus]